MEMEWDINEKLFYFYKWHRKIILGYSHNVAKVTRIIIHIDSLIVRNQINTEESCACGRVTFFVSTWTWVPPLLSLPSLCIGPTVTLRNGPYEKVVIYFSGMRPPTHPSSSFFFRLVASIVTSFSRSTNFSRSISLRTARSSPFFFFYFFFRSSLTRTKQLHLRRSKMRKRR